MFKLAFPNPEWMMGLPLANHMTFFKPADTPDGDHVARKYTPVSPLNQKGSIDFVIKCYPCTEEFPEGGKLGHFLKDKQVGDKILMEGPIGRMTYKGNGNIVIKQRENRRVTKIGLLAGGSGLTPMYSVMNAIYLGKDSTVTQVHMLYSNKTEEDILMRDALDAINADESAPHIKVTHTLTRATSDPANDAANVKRGRVDEAMIDALEGWPEPSNETLIAMCGPKSFNDACKVMLFKKGYTADMIYP